MRPLLHSLSAAMLAMSLTAQAAPDHHHDHGSASPATIELNAGKKWSSDAALRQGMSAIRTLAEKALPEAHAGTLTAARYDALADDVDREIAHIVGTCKLDAKADAQLHILLAELSDGVATMRGERRDAARAAGVVKLSQALNTYGTHFEHAGWRPIKLPH